jgi:hypothetical protein
LNNFFGLRYEELQIDWIERIINFLILDDYEEYLLYRSKMLKSILKDDKFGWTKKKTDFLDAVLEKSKTVMLNKMKIGHVVENVDYIKTLIKLLN